MFDFFQTVLTDVNLKSDINSRILSFSMSTKYDFYKNDLFCSNMAFSGVLRCTQNGHVERCIKDVLQLSRFCAHDGSG